MRFGTTKIPPPMTMPMTIARASSNPRLRGSSERAAERSIHWHYTPNAAQTKAGKTSTSDMTMLRQVRGWFVLRPPHIHRILGLTVTVEPHSTTSLGHVHGPHLHPE